MKLFELIDNWHKRKVLLCLIRKAEKKVKNNDRDIATLREFAEEENWSQAQLIGVRNELIKEGKLLDFEVEFYKNKLNQLL